MALKKQIPLFLLIALWAVLLWKTVPENCVYGSNTDWLSQHAALAETIRDACRTQHTLLPFFLPLGGGSNGFQFSYYGYLRPDILLGCLFPQIPMSKILIGYMLAGYLASVLLFYRLLTIELGRKPEAFWGSVLFLLASCFFHTHRQVMFINYMPFLLAAFLSIHQKKYRSVVVFLVLAFCNSFYYAISILAAVGWYWYEKEGRNFICKYIKTVLLSCGIAAVLLLPSLLAILENRRITTGVSDAWFNIKMESLLYRPYGMGLTVICLYLLLCGVTLRDFRKNSLFYLGICFFGVTAWLLNGTLYVRAKILIPFVPLVVRHCSFVFAYLLKNRSRISFLPFPILFFGLWCNRRAGCFEMMCVDVALVLVWTIFCRWFLGRSTVFLSYTILFLVPVYSFLQNADTESWVTKEQIAEQEQDFAVEISQSPLYRMEMLGTPLASCNVVADAGEKTLQASDAAERAKKNSCFASNVAAGAGRTSMYSSVTNPAYSTFYYDIMRTPIQINNRVALLAEENPFLLHMMGVRYLKTTEEKIPAGFHSIQKKDGFVLAENADVLPIAYVVDDWISEKEWMQMDEIERLEILMKTTVVDDAPGSVINNTSTTTVDNISITVADNAPTSIIDNQPTTFINDTHQKMIQEITPACSVLMKSENLSCVSLPEGGFDISADGTASLCLELEPILKSAGTAGMSDILLLEFDVENKTSQSVEITINQIKNKLSGKSAPYPNENNRFHYQLSEENGVKTLTVTFSKGHYRLKHIKMYACAKELFAQKRYTPVKAENIEKNEIFSCTVATRKDGYFVTSIPFCNGMKILVDGKEHPITKVNTAFAGAKLSKGVHEVTLTFTPPGFRLGLFLSAACGIFFCMCRRKVV